MYRIALAFILFATALTPRVHAYMVPRYEPVTVLQGIKLSEAKAVLRTALERNLIPEGFIDEWKQLVASAHFDTTVTSLRSDTYLRSDTLVRIPLSAVGRTKHGRPITYIVGIIERDPRPHGTTTCEPRFELYFTDESNVPLYFDIMSLTLSRWSTDHWVELSEDEIKTILGDLHSDRTR